MLLGSSFAECGQRSPEPEAIEDAPTAHTRIHRSARSAATFEMQHCNHPGGRLGAAWPSGHETGSGPPAVDAVHFRCDAPAMTAPESTDSQYAPRSEPRMIMRGWANCGAAALVYLTAVLHRSLLGVHGSEAADQYQINSIVLSLLPAVSLLFYAGTQLPMGLLIDRVGPRRVILFALTCLTLGSAIFALAENVWLALFGRVILGLGDACTFLSVLRLGSRWLPAGHFLLVAGMANMLGAVGQLLGAYPLQVVLDLLGWQLGFVLLSGLTALLFLPVALIVRDSPEAKVGVSPPRRSPRLPSIRESLRRVLTSRHVSIGRWLHSVLMTQFLVLTLLWGYPYLVESQSVSKGNATLLVSASIAMFGLGSLAVTLWGRGGIEKLRYINHLGVLTWLTWVAALAWPGQAPIAVLILLFLVSGVAASGVAYAFSITRDGLDPHDVGAASGLVIMFSFTATSILLVAVGTLFTWSVDSGLTSQNAYRSALAIVPLFMALGWARIVSVTRRSRA